MFHLCGEKQADALFRPESKKRFYELYERSSCEAKLTLKDKVYEEKNVEWNEWIFKEFKETLVGLFKDLQTH